MTERQTGFSLIEVLVALSIVLCLSAMMFQLFHQNERVIRDQTLIMEMQQTARIVASQIADEIRMAGQGVPIYSSSFDAVPSEAVAVILDSSNASRIDFRAGLSNVETSTEGGALDFNMGMPQSIAVQSTSGLSAGKFVYVSGTATGSAWSWIRAEVTAVSSTTLTLIPRNAGTTDATIHFTALNFKYYDDTGSVVQPVSLSNRIRITRVDIQLTVVVAGPLSNGSRPTYSLTLRTIPRNLRVRHVN